MGSEARAEEMSNGENLPQNFISISKLPDEIEANNVIVLPQSSTLMANKRTLMRLETPDPEPDREDKKLDLDGSSPVTLVSSPSNSTCFDACPASPDENITQTPKEVLLDSFAPFPDKFLSYSDYRNYKEDSRAHVVRRLNFIRGTNLVNDIDHESNGETVSEDVHLLKSIYVTILDVIKSEQHKDLDSKLTKSILVSDGFMTPPTASHLCQVAKTCPGAPRKCTRKSRIIDKEICKKLEF